MTSPAAAPAVDLTENHNVEIIAVTALLSAVATLTLGTRLWSKKVSHRGFSADDFLLIAAWVFMMGQNVMIASAVKFAHFGYHTATLNLDQIEAFEKAFFANGLILPTCLALTKISILVLLHHLFVTPTFRLTARILGVIVILWWLAAFLGQIFICHPIQSHWDPTVPAHCGDQQALDMGTPIPWIVTDFAILICPIPVLKQLQVSKPQKFGLYALFLVGILTCIVSCIRYSTVWYVIADPAWDVVPLALWSVAEASITVTTASIVASRPALAMIYPSKLISSTRARFLSGGSSRTGGSRTHTKLTDVTDSTNPYPANMPLKNISQFSRTSGILKSQDVSVSITRDE